MRFAIEIFLQMSVIGCGHRSWNEGEQLKSLSKLVTVSIPVTCHFARKNLGFSYESDTATSQHQLQSYESKDYSEFEQIDWFRGNPGTLVIEVKRFEVNKKGFHLAFRDQGSCLIISSLEVYYKSCPETITSFIHLPETFIKEDDENRGRVEVEGECLPMLLLYIRSVMVHQSVNVNKTG